MNYIIPRADQFDQAFLFTIDKRVCNGQTVPKQLLLSKNLNEIDTIPFYNLKRMAKILNIQGRSRMDKNTLSNQIQQRIIFE